MTELRINGQRLWQRLMTMAQIGKTAKGGVCRVTLTEEDRLGRDLFIQWCEAAGCTIEIDQMGSIFATRPGKRDDLDPVLACSHLDSQPTGGKFDGVLGVLAGLEVIETLNDHNIVTEYPITVASWTNEEGARFTPAMIASGVYGGVFDLEYAYNRTDKEGITLLEALEAIGYKGEAPVGSQKFSAALEIHIEQGPLLEYEKKTIGVVTGVQGARWYHLNFAGKEAHAGTTPTQVRQDPVKNMVGFLAKAYPHIEGQSEDMRLTFGEFRASPGVVNTIPGNLMLTMDMRHPNAALLDKLEAWVEELAAEHNATLEKIWDSPPIQFHEKCVAAVARAAELTGETARPIISGAGHDAVYVNRVTPTGMIFIPCEDGLSHNELEHADMEDVIGGGNVLLQAMLQLANEA
ncbi:MAG: Zn-dependent hydrolase [Ardenticatenales bacterium]|nr:Zn-dependent hydrolase [Ardenticatenales bacterium]